MKRSSIKLKRRGGMPPIFKALATIAVWVMFVLGLFEVLMAMIMGFTVPAPPLIQVYLGSAIGVACLILSVCAMKLRQMLE